ncbi:MAG: SRPBCC domain-containing protein [Pirellulales bacterium]
MPANSRFDYVIYIRTTSEKLWRALIDPESTRQYWAETWQDCQWKKGGTWQLMIPDGRVEKKKVPGTFFRLLGHGADPNLVDAYGGCALHYANSPRALEAYELLWPLTDEKFRRIAEKDRARKIKFGFWK